MSENKEYVSQIEGQSNVHISGDAICTVAAVAAVEVEASRACPIWAVMWPGSPQRKTFPRPFVCARRRTSLWSMCPCW